MGPPDAFSGLAGFGLDLPRSEAGRRDSKTSAGALGDVVNARKNARTEESRRSEWEQTNAGRLRQEYPGGRAPCSGRRPLASRPCLAGPACRPRRAGLLQRSAWVGEPLRQRLPHQRHLGATEEPHTVTDLVWQQLGPDATPEHLDG